MAKNQYAFVNNASVQVTTERGGLVAVVVEGGIVNVYDTSSGSTSGTEVVKVANGSGDTLRIDLDVVIENGIYVVASSACTVLYD